MHHVLARIIFKPDAAEAAKGLLLELVAQSLKEPGCVRYELYQQAGAPHVFQTVELWKEEADANAHMTTPHVAAAIAAGGSLFAAAPEIVACNKLT